MKRITALAAAALLLAGASTTFAQSREFGARRLILDDGTGSGFETTLQPFSPMTVSGTFTFPNPATTSGFFIMSNSTLGQSITGGLTNNTFFTSIGNTTFGNGGVTPSTLTLNLTSGADALLTEGSWNTNNASNTTLSFDNTGAGTMNVGIGTATPAGQLANNATNALLVGGSTGMAPDGFNWLSTNGGFAAQIRNSSAAGNANGLGVQVQSNAGFALFAERNGTGTIFAAESDGDGYFLGNLNLGAGAYQTAGVTRIANNGDATLQATTTTTLIASGLVTANSGLNLTGTLRMIGATPVIRTDNNANLEIRDVANNLGVLFDNVGATTDVTVSGNVRGGDAQFNNYQNQNNTWTYISNTGAGVLSGLRVSPDFALSADDLTLSQTTIARTGAIAINPGVGNPVTTNGYFQLAVTGAQGDAIINAINAGSNFIDWARIGTAGGELGTYDLNSGTAIPASIVEANRVVVVSNSSGGGLTFTMPAITKMGHTVSIMRANSGDAITIQDIGTQVLSGNFNNMTPYDVITMLWDGTNWVEMSRSAN